MFESEPARKKARKNVSFREDVKGLVESRGRGHNSTDDEQDDLESEPRGSLLPRKLMAEMEEVRFERVGLNAESIEDEDNEIWVLQCPANMELSDILKGSKIRLDGETEIENGKGGREKFEVIGLPSSETSSSLITLLPGEGRKGKLVGAPVKGHLIVREKIEELPVPKLRPEPKPIHTIPEGIKERHPIYGTDFESVFKAIGSRSKEHKKKKRKSKKLEESFVEVPEIVEPEVRRKKKSHVDSEITLNGHAGHKKSNGYEEETFKVSSKRKSKVLNGLIDPMINAQDLEVSEEKKKKRKSKHHSEDPNGSVNGHTNGHAYELQESHYNGKIKSDRHLDDSTSKPRRSKKFKLES